jgi:hypothetical protein
MTTENMKAIVASHRISPASVPSLAEIVEPIRVNIIDLLRHLATNAAMSIRLRLKAEALRRIALRIEDN